MCVDEHKLLRDIERLLKKEIPRIAIAGYEPDPSIKAEPIQNGRPAARRRVRGQGQGRGGQSQGRSGQPRSQNNAPRRQDGERRKRALRTANRRAAVARVNRLANNTLMSGPR
ncbi:ATP-dependent RNA helicase RhlE [Klebsiella pneumoniae]|uniref:ATP-dependent RNA helicase RhlE n=1 Tax=Klebsiella pneumoniae TaxID=573 RepID=A0A447S428_KLEPN|nr:ATP-dependent RNA helicase RhlE [Klebsiella pneumoniae]